MQRPRSPSFSRHTASSGAKAKVASFTAYSVIAFALMGCGFTICIPDNSGCPDSFPLRAVRHSRFYQREQEACVTELYGAQFLLL